MSKRGKTLSAGTMLDLWRPPQGAGDPVGCLATTFTFQPELFDEQCLARFLEIESEPDREDLAFLLERESLLGGVYAGVLVDHTQAGVAHSLRWDVMPVRIPAGKQHAKLSLLAWTRHVRLTVASANLTEAGYRFNHEVAAAVDLTPRGADPGILAAAADFLRRLITLVPGASEHPPEVRRARAFLDQVERQVQGWKHSRPKGPTRQQLACTLPDGETGGLARSSLQEAFQACRQRGGSPDEAWVASPFFDVSDGVSLVTAALCKLMARGVRRKLRFCVPASRDDEQAMPRLAAPKSLWTTPRSYRGDAAFSVLPEVDSARNRRQWHAKMLSLRSNYYSVLMIGSSNFTCAGMGVGPRRNAEVNLLTIADRVTYDREAGELEALWPDMDPVIDPDAAEWVGAQSDREEEELAAAPALPAGFLSATYYAGDCRRITMRLDRNQLPEDWRISGCGQDKSELLSASAWQGRGRPSSVDVAWLPVQPPEKLLVQWSDREAFLSLNVEDSRELPAPAELEHMSADDMLWILAAADPSAAFRAWAKQRSGPGLFDTDLDSATPIDLDPLKRYDLHATFLHLIRRRARMFAQLRQNLQRPVVGRQALEWRLRGLIGVEPLADRMLRQLQESRDRADEALLTLADFLIVLREVDYQPRDGSLPRAEFDEVFRPFLEELVDKIDRQVDAHRARVAPDLVEFWDRVVGRCRG